MATKNVDLSIKIEAIKKLFVDLSSGKANLREIIVFLDQNHIPELQELKPGIKTPYVDFEAMLNQHSESKNPENTSVKLLQLNEVVCAFEGLADAYVLAYKGLDIVLNSLSKDRASLLSQVENQQIDRFLLGIYPGDTKCSIEDRELTQIVVIGLLGRVKLETVELAIRKAISVIEYGFLCYQCYFNYSNKYRQAVEDFTKAFDALCM